MTPQTNSSKKVSPKMDPLVSICIPTYNRAAMVSKAISSALCQTYSNIELIIVDNASTDDIEDVVSSFSDDPRIHFYKNEKNLGLFGNFNRCIELASGKYIHILHSDDWIDPSFTATCTRYLESHPDIAMTFTTSIIHTGEITESFKVSESTQIFTAPEGFRQMLLRRGFISCPSVMIRRDIYNKIGLFSLEYPYSADYYQWMKICLKYNVAYIRDATLHYRQGEHSESYRLLFKSPLGYIDTLKIFLQLMSDITDSAQEFQPEINTALRRFSRDCVYAGFLRSGNMCFIKPAFFPSIARVALSLIQPRTMRESVTVAFDLVTLWIAAQLLKISFSRHLIKKIFVKRQDFY